jgi:hypothetical protein
MSTAPGKADRMLTGRCECRAVRYRVPDAFLYSANCHCSNCRASTGSAFKPFAGIQRAFVHVAMGSLADDPTIRPTAHIFVGSKAPWFEITDDLPRAEEY